MWLSLTTHVTTNFLNSYNLHKLAIVTKSKIQEAVTDVKEEIERIKGLPWQQWDKRLSRMYSDVRLRMIEATLLST